MIGVGQRGPRPDGSGPQPRRGDAPVSERSGWTGWTGLDLDRLPAVAERPYWIAISLLPGVGPVGFARLLHRFGSARAAWAAGDALLEELPRVPADAASTLARMRRAGATEIARRVDKATRSAGGTVLTAMDADYPPALRASDPRPAVLYLAGDPAAFRLPAVAVVGTRRASGYGRSCAVRVADELARAGVAVVSGLAMGIDGEAHAAAVAAGGRSIAVLPSPLDRIYPPRHRELAKRLVSSGGALLTELAPGHQPGRPDFARRNRIIAGLSRATVVVEAPDHSGALLTASAAVELRREVYAVPGPIDSVTSSGCNRLIADHIAALVTSPAALLPALGLQVSAASPGAIATLSDPEALVLARLLRHPASLEELVTPTELAAGAVASALTLLEARGLVTSYGGATFHPTLAARRLGRHG